MRSISTKANVSRESVARAQLLRRSLDGTVMRHFLSKRVMELLR